MLSNKEIRDLKNYINKPQMPNEIAQAANKTEKNMGLKNCQTKIFAGTFNKEENFKIRIYIRYLLPFLLSPHQAFHVICGYERLLSCLQQQLPHPKQYPKLHHV